MWSWAADKIDRTQDVKQKREGASVQNVTQLDAKCRVIEGNRLVNCSKMTRFLCCHPRSPCKWQTLSFGGNCIISNKAFQGVGWFVGNVSWRWQSGMVWWGPRSKAIAADRLMKSLTNWDVSLMINWDHIKISHSREHQQIKDPQRCCFCKNKLLAAQAALYFTPPRYHAIRPLVAYAASSVLDGFI